MPSDLRSFYLFLHYLHARARHDLIALGLGLSFIVARFGNALLECSFFNRLHHFFTDLQRFALVLFLLMTLRILLVNNLVSSSVDLYLLLRARAFKHFWRFFFDWTLLQAIARA